MKPKFNIGITRYQRISSYLENLKANIPIKNKTDKKLICEIEEIISQRVRQVRRVTAITTFCYFGVYFSFISLFFTSLFFLTQVASLFGSIISASGTTAFFIGIFFGTRLRELYYQDLALLTSHLIAVYDKNHNYGRDLFEERNDYNIFIEFFKKRGFY